jgi:hypothetical protein
MRLVLLGRCVFWQPGRLDECGGAELLRSLRAEADRVAAISTELRNRIDTPADPTAATACACYCHDGGWSCHPALV